jgi:hypothetical protein
MLYSILLCTLLLGKDEPFYRAKSAWDLCGFAQYSAPKYAVQRLLLSGHPHQQLRSSATESASHVSPLSTQLMHRDEAACGACQLTER